MNLRYENLSKDGSYLVHRTDFKTGEISVSWNIEDSEFKSRTLK
jgi:hypothetical protein